LSKATTSTSKAVASSIFVKKDDFTSGNISLPQKQFSHLSAIDEEINEGSAIIYDDFDNDAVLNVEPLRCI